MSRAARVVRAARNFWPWLSLLTIVAVIAWVGLATSVPMTAIRVSAIVLAAAYAATEAAGVALDRRPRREPEPGDRHDRSGRGPARADRGGDPMNAKSQAWAYLGVWLAAGVMIAVGIVGAVDQIGADSAAAKQALRVVAGDHATVGVVTALNAHMSAPEALTADRVALAVQLGFAAVWLCSAVLALHQFVRAAATRFRAVPPLTTVDDGSEAVRPTTWTASCVRLAGRFCEVVDDAVGIVLALATAGAARAAVGRRVNPPAAAVGASSEEEPQRCAAALPESSSQTVTPATPVIAPTDLPSTQTGVTR